MRDIGKNIRTLREQKNLTQEELAERLFVTRQTVSNYETGKTRPDVDTILKIAEILETDANTVFYGPATPPDQKAAYRKLIIGGIVLVLLVAALVYLTPIAKYLKSYRYLMGLNSFLLAVLNPVILFLFGWLLMCGLSLLLKFKPLAGRWVKYAKWTLVAVLCLLLIFSLPFTVYAIVGDYLALTEGSVSLTFPNIPVLSDVSMWVWIANAKAPAAYALLGGALWLFSPPKKKDSD